MRARPVRPAPRPVTRPRSTQRGTRWGALALALAALAVPSTMGIVTQPADAARPISARATSSTPAPTMWLTSPVTTSRRLATTPTTTRAATVTVTVNPSDLRQTWWGTGAALTDSSVELLKGRDDLTALLFDPKRADGARLDALRLPLSGTDFSRTPWTWGWDGSKAVPTQQAYDAASALVGGVLSRRPDLKVVGSPWSAPADFKTSGSVRGGSLKDTSVPAYARMLASQVQQLRSAGVPLTALTLGNEPGYATDYASMTMSLAQMAELGAQTKALLPSGVALWAGDHNWEHRSAYDQLVAGAKAGTFDGSAYHCYGGDPSQMNGPTAFRIITECTGTTDTWASTFGWDMRNLVVAPVAAGSSGLLMFNLALDGASGPVDTGSQYGCKNCRGLLQVTPSGTTTQPEFYALAHLSRAVQPGGRAAGFTVTRSGTAGTSPAGTPMTLTAFRNTDGTTGVVGMNDTGYDQVYEVKVGSTSVRYAVAKGDFFTFRG